MGLLARIVPHRVLILESFSKASGKKPFGAFAKRKVPKTQNTDNKNNFFIIYMIPIIQLYTKKLRYSILTFRHMY